MGVWVWGHHAANFSHIETDAQENSTSFNEKPTKKLKLRGLKLRGLRQNQISTRYLTCENDRRNQINTLGDS